ncbi:hypothetical protein [Arcobacter sp.]|uniref:hypothetical protein n=1 Tax=Arcobacter sp. TaxID=1872629 RepID=UPI003C79605C
MDIDLDIPNKNSKESFHNKLKEFSNNLTLLEKGLSDIKSKYKKIALYGYGITSKLIAPYLEDQLVIIADKNSTNIKSSYKLCDPKDLTNYDFDCIVITLLGIEEKVINYLLKLDVLDSKIITLVETLLDSEQLFNNKTGSELEAGICTQEQLESKTYQMWINYFKENSKEKHRKLWEYAFIAESLKNREMLQKEKKGLGFAVGTEPLPSAFCSYGTQILATDLDIQEAKNSGWVDTNQHANNLPVLNKRKICNNKQFSELCTFQNLNMNEIPDSLKDFDFIWSSCALEHLGTIKLGEEFIYNSLKCLKPGGIAVHTTEYNFSSNNDTVSEGPVVLFRKKDIERIVDNLEKDGHEVVDINYNSGKLPLDKYIDFPPYNKQKHLKLYHNSYIITSIGLIIRKKS